MSTHHSILARVLVSVALAALLTAALTGGCGNKGGGEENTPAAVAEAFLNHMKANEVKEAAALFAYDEAARAQNEDWDTFGEQQRRLIRGKMQEEKAALLQQLQPSFTAEAAGSEPKIEGDRAVVQITGAGAQTSLTLVKEDGQWKISGF